VDYLLYAIALANKKINYEQHGIIIKDCIKLWILYPNTSHNISLFKKHCTSKNIFLRLYTLLEGGKLFITTKSIGIYMPPGWIHGTYTLSGSLIIGVEFAFAECLMALAQALHVNSFHGSIKKDNYEPFL
jgi:hypothetical protein